MNSAREYAEAEQEMFDSMELLTRCVFCEWTYLGTAAAGRQEASEHRSRAHPGAVSKLRRGGRHLSTFRSPSMHAEETAEIQAERKKRAFLHGLELSE